MEVGLRVNPSVLALKFFPLGHKFPHHHLQIHAYKANRKTTYAFSPIQKECLATNKNDGHTAWRISACFERSRTLNMFKKPLGMLNCFFFGIASFRVFLFYLKKNILRQMCPVNDLKSQTTDKKKKKKKIWQWVLGQDICSCIFLQNSLGKKRKEKRTLHSASHMFIAILDSRFTYELAYDILIL